MPLIQITAPEGVLTKAQQDVFVASVSNAVLEAERAPITDAGAQSLVWAYYQEQAQGSIYVGGENLEKAPLRIDVTTPEGALNEATRAELVASIGAIVDEFIGPYTGRLNHWTMLYELDEGSWSGSGQIFRLADIQAAMNIKAA